MTRKAALALFEELDAAGFPDLVLAADPQGTTVEVPFGPDGILLRRLRSLDAVAEKHKLVAYACAHGVVRFGG